MSAAFEDRIAGICNTLGLTAPETLDGAFHLAVDDMEVSLLLNETGENMVFQSVVSVFTEPPTAETLGDVAEANFYWGATGGATLGLNRRSGEVVLAREWPLEALDDAKMTSLLETFIDAATFWNQRLSGGGSGSGSGSATRPEGTNEAHPQFTIRA